MSGGTFCRLDFRLFRRSFEGRSAGSFPEQRLALLIEPTGAGAYSFYVIDPGLVNRSKAILIMTRDFYRLITEIGELDKSNCCVNVKSILSIFHDFNDMKWKSDIVVFWHKLDSKAEKTHPRVTTDLQT